MAKHNEFGKRAEQLAADYLTNKGYRILARNWRYGKEELDLVAMDGDTLVIVEVKARTSDYFGDPAEAVSKSKIKHLVQAADAFVQAHGLDAEVRFDIVSIIQNKNREEIRHYENAFYWF